MGSPVLAGCSIPDRQAQSLVQSPVFQAFDHQGSEAEIVIDAQDAGHGDGEKARVLRDLAIDPNPFQFRYAEGMTSSFDLANPDFVPPKGS